MGKRLSQMELWKSFGTLYDNASALKKAKARVVSLLKDVEKQAALLHSVTAPENVRAIYDVLLEDFSGSRL